MVEPWHLKKLLYLLCSQWKFKQNYAFAQSHQNLGCLHMQQYSSSEEVLDRELEILVQLMAEHAHVSVKKKKEIKERKKI